MHSMWILLLLPVALGVRTDGSGRVEDVTSTGKSCCYDVTAGRNFCSNDVCARMPKEGYACPTDCCDGPGLRCPPSYLEAEETVEKAADKDVTSTGKSCCYDVTAGRNFCSNDVCARMPKEGYACPTDCCDGPGLRCPPSYLEAEETVEKAADKDALARNIKVHPR
ncbi:unnamed protein product [Effrenium voratum]|uniref:Uncharacterized protein n=1 Tax=Effrenium voratum TaxID=2562239 RepID=A0AA36NAU9_9DINO|nr:unnamed protein product [Effrenium voratum]CAJ1399139.1 unnamed protein product [Effrenium voratum]CAJ1415086.1 unnamed protein product [Effrenium voratum]